MEIEIPRSFIKDVNDRVNKMRTFLESKPTQHLKKFFEDDPELMYKFILAYEDKCPCRFIPHEKGIHKRELCGSFYSSRPRCEYLREDDDGGIGCGATVGYAYDEIISSGYMYNGIKAMYKKHTDITKSNEWWFFQGIQAVMKILFLAHQQNYSSGSYKYMKEEPTEKDWKEMREDE